MREIKVRAWDKEEGQMLYSDKEYYDYDFRCDEHGNLMCYSNCSYADTFGDEYDKWIKLNNIMQYTGLKDKSGTEIYEGDYLLISGYSYEEPEEDWEGIITMGQFGWCLDGVSSNGDKQCYPLNEIGGSYITTYEVAGNIYENPELMEGENEKI